MAFAADYYKAIEPMIKAAASQPPAPVPSNVIELRDSLNVMMRGMFGATPAQPQIKQSTFDVPVPGGTKVTVTRFATQEQLAAKGQPAVMYLHAGGMVCGSVEIMTPAIAAESAAMGIQYFAVEYTKSPAVAAPVALEEAYAVLVHLSQNAAALGLDSKRLAVAGASAGGGMTAGVGLMARDRGLSPPIAKLLMIYPMLDDRTVQAHPPKGARHAGANTKDDDWAVRPLLTWTCEQNALSWAAYLGLGSPSKDDALACAASLAKASAPGTGTGAAYAIPARASSLAGLPSSYIDCGGLDLFLEENAQFAARLAHDQVPFDFHVFHGVPHGFEAAPETNAAKTAAAQRKHFLSTL
ncbi:hypothetical protein SCUCBS95973_007382 [Sporothrix curviconia]|uniref:Alpha/beta hydrolase fold-3 domain-containing protein n=1 Tax=Sporothrix curviconia TaxID=1260050 RepID=A0ABP0CCW2_9PEZI